MAPLVLTIAPFSGIPEGVLMSAVRPAALFVTLVLVGCRKPPTSHRVELRKQPGDLVELVPNEGNPPYCLVYSVAEHGAIRQLTMNETNDSFDCPAGVPIGKTTYRIPKSEGKARIFVLFSDQKLLATTVATQISDLGSPNFNTLDLRVPGRAVSDVIEYEP
jgi:hypothetical protein